MVEWRSTSIGALCDSGLAEVQTGPFGSQLHAHDYVEDGVPVVPTEAIRDRRIEHAVLPKISPAKADELGRHRLKVGDILFARRGVQATGHVGVVRIAEQGFICGTGAIRLRVKNNQNEVSADFLSHVLADPASVAWFKFHAIGATMPNLNEGIIRSFTFNFPPLAEQVKISAFLSCLDNMIDLNRRMNETLEAMARAIFNDWFVNFGPTRAKMEGSPPYLTPDLWALFSDRFSEDGKPAGWSWGTLGDMAAQTGVVVAPASLAPTTPYIGLEHMPRRSLALEAWGDASSITSAKTAFRHGDLLFGKLRPYFHKVGIAPIDGVCSTDIVVLKAKAACARAFVAACVSQDEFVAYTDRTADGTKMPRTTWGRMAMYEICLPTDPVIEAFSKLAAPMFDRIVANVHTLRSIASTRDLLLPRLVSGRIRTKDVERESELAR